MVRSEHSGNRDTLLRFRDDKRFVIREVGISVDDCAKIKKLYDELKKYGIEVPVNFVVAEKNDKARQYYKSIGVTSGTKGLYAIVDNIEWADVGDPEIKQKFEKETIDLYRKIISYYEDKMKAKEYYLLDIGSWEQYVYGRKAGDEEDYIYLVDVGGEYTKDPLQLMILLETKLLSEIIDVELNYNQNKGDIIKRANELLALTKHI